jgi:pSer/pThr/pTyr-binding forkhead associated (FHA) protein
MPRLVLHAGTAQARGFELKPGSNYLGRAFSNDFKIEDPSVSGSHVQIVIDGDVIMVKDLGSTNGTFINRSQVREGYLQPGQLLNLGSVELLVEADSGATPSSLSPNAVPPMPATNGSSYHAPIVARVSAPPPAPRAVAPPPSPPPRTQAPAAAEPVAGMVDPPKGKTACKFHRTAAGQWLCQACSELFCSLCVTTRRTDEGSGAFCRKCGTQCVPVKVKLVAKKEKQLTVYSDGMVLMRSVGFAFAGAVLGAAIWIGISRGIGFDVPFLFCPLAGFLCGYGVKIGSQDRPGAVFSSIASVFCIISCVVGKVGMIFATGLNTYSSTSLLTSFAGLAIGIFLAWKFGGGDF